MIIHAQNYFSKKFHRQQYKNLNGSIVWGLRVGGHQVLSLHSSNEPGELSQWLCHDDSTIKIVVVIIIIMISWKRVGLD